MIRELLKAALCIRFSDCYCVRRDTIWCFRKHNVIVCVETQMARNRLLRSNKKPTLADQNTGNNIMREITVKCQDDQELRIYTAPKKVLNGDFLTLFQYELSEIAKDREINLTDMRVYLFVLSQIEFQNEFCMSQNELEEALGINRANIARSLKKLCEKKILVHTGNQGKQKIYHLHPEHGYRGKLKNYGTTLKRIKDGEAPGQNKYLVTNFYTEEKEAPNLVEILSKEVDIPCETVERLLSVITAMQETKE